MCVCVCVCVCLFLRINNNYAIHIITVVVVVFFTLTDWPSTIPSTVIYVVANPVRGLLNRKRSEEHLVYKASTREKKT